MKRPIQIFNYVINQSSQDAVDIFIDGSIVDAETQELYKLFWGDDTSVSYKSFRESLEKHNAGTYNVYINSPGGMVTDAMAIHDYLVELQSKGKTVNTIGRGIVASAATYILMAAKSPSLSKNSWFMIHNVSGAIWGDVNEVEQYAAMMRKFNNACRDFYAQFTGIRKEDVTKMMDSETWMTADEAKEKGFIKEVTGDVSFTNYIPKDHWQFNNTAVLNSYNSFTKNTPEMKFNFEEITKSFKNVLIEAGIIKDDKGANDMAAKLSAAMENALKPAVTASEQLDEKITNAVTKALENFKPEAADQTEAITNAVNEAVKNLAKAEDLTALKNDLDKLTNDVANKLGKPLKQEKKEEDADRKVNSRRDFFQVGTFED